MWNNSLRRARLEATGTSVLFHVLSDVNCSNSFPPDFSCPLFTNNEDEIGTHKDSGRSFKGQIMERSSWKNGETIVGQVVHACMQIFTLFASITEI